MTIVELDRPPRRHPRRQRLIGSIHPVTEYISRFPEWAVFADHMVNTKNFLLFKQRMYYLLLTEFPDGYGWTPGCLAYYIFHLWKFYGGETDTIENSLEEHKNNDNFYSPNMRGGLFRMISNPKDTLEVYLSDIDKRYLHRNPETPYRA